MTGIHNARESSYSTPRGDFVRGSAGCSFHPQGLLERVSKHTNTERTPRGPRSSGVGPFLFGPNTQHQTRDLPHRTSHPEAETRQIASNAREMAPLTRQNLGVTASNQYRRNIRPTRGGGTTI